MMEQRLLILKRKKQLEDILKKNNKKYGETASLSKDKNGKMSKFLQPFKIEKTNSDFEKKYSWKFLQDDMDNSGLDKNEREKVENFIKDYINGDIPEETPDFLKRSNNSYNYGSILGGSILREEARVFANTTKKFAKSAREVLPEDAVVLDPMAGRGYLTKSFREAGIPTIASDDDSWGISKNENIEKINAVLSIEKHSKEATHVVIAWPPYQDPTAYRIMKKADELGLGIIYIGETYGGATADDRFHEHFEIDENIPDYETFNGLNDYALIGHYDEDGNDNPPPPRLIFPSILGI